MCYAISASIVGTQAVLNSKCLALLLDATTRGEKDEFAFWYLYFMLGTWLVLVLYWLVRLDHGLSLFPPVFIIPMMQAFFLVFAILCGGIYLEEFVNFSLAQCVGFTAGVALILAGVYGLAPVGMILHVPGDPAAPAPVKIADSCGSAMVHTECVLTDKQRDLENAELDQQLQAILSLKPQPEQQPDINLFSAAVQPGGEDENAQPSPDSGGASSTRTGGASKKNRRVVKRPLNVETVALPPVQVRGAVELCNLNPHQHHHHGASSAHVSPRGCPAQEGAEEDCEVLVPAAPLIGMAGALALVHDSWQATTTCTEHGEHDNHHHHHHHSPRSRRGSADHGLSPRGVPKSAEKSSGVEPCPV
jgi:hypothetical protein